MLLKSDAVLPPIYGVRYPPEKKLVVLPIPVTKTALIVLPVVHVIVFGPTGVVFSTYPKLKCDPEPDAGKVWLKDASISARM